MEKWRVIRGYPNYEISNLGRVKSLNYNHTGKPKLLKIHQSKRTGYLCVVLWNEKKYKVKLVHRLVAENFIPNPQGFKTVNHKDECKTNNAVSNLEWCTLYYNNHYGTKAERCSQHLIDNPLITKPVYQLDKQGNIINEFISTVRAAEYIGCTPAEISRVCLGHKYRKTTHGYCWKFKEDYS